MTYQTSGGGLANVALLAQSKCDLAIIHDAEAKAAINGLPPFDSKMDHLATIAQLYTWAPMQAIVNADFAAEHGIESLEDIAARKLPIKLVLNKRGNIASDIGAAMLTAVGASPGMIESWGGSVQYAGSTLLNSLFVNHSSIRELASAIDVKLLPVSGENAQKVIADWDIKAFTIPNDAYDRTAADVETLTLSAQLFVRADADADARMVGDIVKAITDHSGEIQGVHKAMKPLDVALVSGATTVAYHPAAKEVYKQAGY